MSPILSSALLTAVKAAPGDPKKPTAAAPPMLSEAELRAFANYGGTTDPKGKAAYLASKGLVGASQILTDHPDVSTEKGIINAQSNWKTSAIEAMLMQARKMGLKTPTQLSNNKAGLMSAIDPRIKEALNHPAFNQIHPNFWETFNGIVKDQYDNEAAAAPAANLAAK
jgi:hypothetical protein